MLLFISVVELNILLVQQLMFHYTQQHPNHYGNNIILLYWREVTQSTTVQNHRCLRTLLFTLAGSRRPSIEISSRRIFSSSKLTTLSLSSSSEIVSTLNKFLLDFCLTCASTRTDLVQHAGQIGFCVSLTSIAQYNSS